MVMFHRFPHSSATFLQGLQSLSESQRDEIAALSRDGWRPVQMWMFAFSTLWSFNIAMENGPFIDDFPIKTSIYKGFSMAMLNNQMVIWKNMKHAIWIDSYRRMEIDI